MLDLSSLKKAVASMDRAWNYIGSRIEVVNLSEDEKEILKAAVIQNFEFTYELCWKYMKRWLQMNLTPELTDGISRRQLFRYAAENHLIKDVNVWVKYHELRNKTSHTYDTDIAEEIFVHAAEFLQEAREVLSALEARND